MASVATAMQQIEVLTAELNSLRQEIVLVKGNHASLHQATVETTQASTTKMNSPESRLEEIANASERFTGKGRKPLIEPKQVEVPQFAGSITDG